MKKIVIKAFIFLVPFVFALNVNAQMMEKLNSSKFDWNAVLQHTVQGEKSGKEVFDKLQSKQLQCANLSDDDFAALGEYFMGQMMGDSHSAMNAMMMQMMGEQGEEQMHIAMGKRLSGCQPDATFSQGTSGWMPMMQMMWGGRLSPFGFNSTNNSMMNFGYGFGIFGWFFMLLWWVLIIAAFVALIKWLTNQFKNGTSGKSALDILKERYAKGEIDKKEFEEKKELI